jgi:hypothetical protein
MWISKQEYDGKNANSEQRNDSTDSIPQRLSHQLSALRLKKFLPVNQPDKQTRPQMKNLQRRGNLQSMTKLKNPKKSGSKDETWTLLSGRKVPAVKDWDKVQIGCKRFYELFPKDLEARIKRVIRIADK